MPTLYKKRFGSQPGTVILFLLSYTFIYFALCYQYLYFVSPVHSYAGFLSNFSLYKFIEGLGLIILTSLLLPKDHKKPSTYLVHFHFVFPIIGMLVIYSCADRERFFIYASTIAFFAVIAISKIRVKQITFGNARAETIMRICGAIGFVYIACIILLTGFSYFNLNIFEVYSYRRGAAEALPGIFGYITPAVAGVIVPVSVVLALYTRSRIGLLASVSLAFLCFAFTAHKGPLVVPLVLVGMTYLLNRPRPLLVCLLAFMTFLVVSTSLYLIDIQNPVGNLLTRRMVLVPPLLNYFYYDFFDHFGHVYWANSKITFGAVAYRFELGAANLIGEQFFANSDTSANTGWIGSGFMHAGILGLAVYAVLVGLILSFIDTQRTKWTCATLVGIYITPMNNVFTASDLLTAMLTHGLLFLMLIVTCTDAKISTSKSVSRLKDRSRRTNRSVT